MKTLFEYNWQVRDEWFSWCKTIPEHELLKPRVGGVGGILQTLFHVVVVEYSWICDMTGYPDIQNRNEPQTSLDHVVSLSLKLHPIVNDFVSNWTDEQERQTVTVTLAGETQTFLCVARYYVISLPMKFIM